MPDFGLTMFDTAIGPCGIAWGPRGIRSVQLPEATRAATQGRLHSRCPGAVDAPPPGTVQAAIAAIATLLRGEPSDLGAIVLDMDRIPAFDRRVYAVARAIPPGTTLTYGEVATRLGEPGAARAVGQALGRNPFAIVVPCHRVVAAGGAPGGFSALGGIATKRRILRIEGAERDAPMLPGIG